jgi:hypothetical protein
MLIFILAAILGFTNPATPGDVVYVEFTRETSFDDLVQIRTDLDKRNITMDYLHIQFDDTGQLTALSFKADSNDGTSGSGKCDRFHEGHKLTFKRDYTPGANPSIAITSGPGER